MPQGTPSRLLVAGACALAWAGAAAGAGAQTWRGTGAVEVEVTDRGGKPVAGAQVVLRYVETQPRAGPPPAATDATGTAAVHGLAEGRWLFEVAYRGTSPYSAVLRVEAGRRAVVIAGPVRDAAAPPLNVKYVKPGPPPTRQRREREPPQPAAPATPPEPDAGPTAAPAEETAPTPEPRPAAPRPSKPEPPPPAPGAAPEPTEPAPPHRGSPAPPAPEAPPALPQSLRSARNGSCPECAAGEWAVGAEAAAGPAGGSGRCAAAAAAREAIRLLGAAAEPGFRGYAGPLLDPATGRVVAVAASGARAAAERLLAPYAAPAAPCQVLAVVLPEGARFRGYAYEVSDSGGGGACAGDEECDVGLARWESHPAIERTPEGTIVFGVFHNRSPDRERRARLTVYFTPPSPEWPG